MNSQFPVFALVVVIGLAITPIQAADVGFYGIFKEQRFRQENPAAPSLKHSDSSSDQSPLRFNVSVDMASANSVTNATIQIPGGATRNLIAETDSLEFQDYFRNMLELNSEYTSGTYTLTIGTKNDGTKIISMSLTGDTYPAIPRISNFIASQSVATNSGFTLTWDAWSGGTVNDFVELTIRDEQGSEIYTSPDFGAPGALNGTSTSALIPAGALPGGRRLTGRLMFARASTFDTTSYAGVTGIAAYLKDTEFPFVTTGGSDTTPPGVQSDSPHYAETDVPVNSLVTFTFSEPMQNGQSITWSNVTGANFSYAWSSNGTTLFCKYNANLPTSTVIGWTLNKTGFHDVAGNQMTNDLSGFFATSSQTPSSAHDAIQYFLFKEKEFVQTNSAAAVTNGLHQFGFSVEGSGRNTVTNVTVQIPVNGRTFALLPDSYEGRIEAEARYATQADLDSLLPNGTYNITLNTAHEGNQNVSLILANDVYPNAPTIANFTAAQAIDSSNNFALNWAAFSGGTTNDFMTFEVESDMGNRLFSSGDPGQPGALLGTNLSVTIPSGTLYPGRTYQAILSFYKVVNTNLTSYAGVTGSALYASQTKFNLVTTGTPIKPQLTGLGFSGNNFSIRLSGEPGRSYTVEYTENLQSSGTIWNRLQSQSLQGTSTWDVTDFSAQFSTTRYYRAREGF